MIDQTESRHPIEKIAEEFTSRCRAGERPSIDDYADRYPEHAREIRELFPALLLVEQAAATDTSAARRSETHADAAGDPADDFLFPVPRYIGRFEVRDVVGSGGFGVVFDAYDPELKRRVALKIPRPEAAVNTEFRRRFQREAEVAAALEHPHIVSIYEAGEAADSGVCYIASAFVEGVSLAEWLQQRPGPAEPDQAAELVAVLAEAIQHAHSRGVIHRDLKPANVLLSAVDGRSPVAQAAPDVDAKNDGESTQRPPAGNRPTTDHGQLANPRIADFGLARIVDDGAAETRTNAILGTAAYMAPEQAAGDSRSVGTSADVYSLGAILYELLTGRPPFQRGTTLETLQAVRNEPPTAPRKVCPEVPRDLDAVCLKCLEKRPEDRYASAAELAADLRRYRSAEPVTARALSPRQRAVRWCARKPLQAALLGTLLVSIGAVGGTVVAANVTLNDKNSELRATNRELDEANRNLKAANAELKRARDRAAGNFRKARAAANMLLGELVLGGAATSPHLPSIRGVLAGKVIEFHRAFVHDESGDPAVRRDSGRALAEIGIIEFRSKRFAAAERALKSAIQNLEDAPANNPDEALEVRMALANACLFLAIIELQSDRRDAGETHLAASEQHRQAIDIGGATTVETRVLLADAFDSLRLGYQLLGRTNEAAEVCLAAEPLLKSLEEAAGDTGQAPYRVAAVSLHSGILLSRIGRLDEAEAPLLRARRIATRLVESAPDESGLHSLLATVHYSLGTRHRRAGRLDRSLAAHRLALEAFEALARKTPLSPIYRQQLGQQSARVAYVLRLKKDDDEARRFYQRAVKIAESLRREYPAFAAYQFDLAVHTSGLAYAEFRLKNKQAAVKAAETAIALLEPLATAKPGNALYRSQLGIAQGNLATFTASPGRIRENRALLERAIENLEAASRTDAHSDVLAGTLRRNLMHLARICLAQKDHAGAAAFASRLSKIEPRRAFPLLEAARICAICVTLTRRDASLTDPRREQLKEEYSRRGIRLLRTAITTGLPNPARMQQDPLLAPFRNREDFRSLLEENRR